MVQEDMMGRIAMESLVERFNNGEPLASMDPHNLRLIWEAWDDGARRTGHKNFSVGADYLIALGVDAASLQGEAMAVCMLRQVLFSSLAERGVLDHFREGSSFRDEVFQAAATMPFNKEDLLEATALKQLRDIAPDAAATLRAEMVREGFDPEHPRVDQKLLSWITDQEQKPE